MNGRYSIRREPEAFAVPFGAAGIGALAAAAAGVVGLLVPVSVLESLSFHLYLDTITDFAKPPLGTTAKLLGALVAALATGAIAYGVARWFGVEAAPDGFDGLLDRLRGVDRDDEEDAPALRSADRHPDAPARRPFSAMRDIPDRAWDDGDELDLQSSDIAPDARDDDEELLLDMTVAGQDQSLVEPEMTDPIVVDAPLEAESILADVLRHDEDIANFDLAPLTLDDWEQPPVAETGEFEPAQIEPVTTAGVPVDATEAQTIVPPPAPARPVARRDTAPLDLSAARLDELIARLEAGLSRKATAVPVAAYAMDDMLVAEAETDDGDGSPAVAEAGPMVDDDPAFPHDPALAAALATLRKMNLRTA